MRLVICLVCIWLFCLGQAKAQELQCEVTIVSDQIRSVPPELFNSMKLSIKNFVNNYRFGNANLKPEERIVCNFLFVLKNAVTENEFEGELQIQSRRPVYGSSYQSPLLLIRDEQIHFQYNTMQPLVYNQSFNTDNLVNLLVFYGNLIIGFDYDSFSLLGGDKFYQNALTIVNNAQSGSEKGWQPQTGKEGATNRYRIITTLLNKPYQSFREALYTYHRNGLDLMSKNPEEARSEIFKSLKTIEQLFNTQPSLYITELFFSAKFNELINIFRTPNEPRRNEAMLLLKKIDPSNSIRYDKIVAPITN